MNHETETPPREDEFPPSYASVEPPAKRARTSTIREELVLNSGERTAPGRQRSKKNQRIVFEFYNNALAKKRPLSHASLSTETTQAQSIQQLRDHRSAPYKHTFFVELLKDHGSFMKEYDEGITAESEELCQTLLQTPQMLPQDSLFSDDKLFKKTCERLSGENETKVIRDIAQLTILICCVSHCPSEIPTFRNRIAYQISHRSSEISTFRTRVAFTRHLIVQVGLQH
jgi:hypothetical protein